MFRKIVSNLPFSPSLINQLGFYSKRLKREQFTRKIGLVFTALAIITQTMTFVSPSKASMAASMNDIIYSGGGKQTTINTYNRGCDTRGRCDIKQIFNMFGINGQNLASARLVSIHSTLANNYWSIGRAPRSYGGVNVPLRVPGTGTTIYSRSLHGWNGGLNKWWQALEVDTAQGKRWILTDCGNVVTRPNVPKPTPDVQTTKKVDNAAPLKGQQFNYTIDVRNNGPAVATGVGMRDLAPNGVAFLSISGPGTPRIFNGNEAKTTTAMTLAVGQSVRFNVKARMDVDGPARRDNTACTLGNNGDNNPKNNCGTSTVLIRQVCPIPGKETLPADDKNCNDPSMKIVKTVSKSQVKVGEEFTYKIVATNTGDVDLPKAVIRDTAPENIEFISVKKPGANTFVPVANKKDYVSEQFYFKKGASVTYEIKAKALKYFKDAINNKACILGYTAANTPVGACDDEKITTTPEEEPVCPFNPALKKNDPKCYCQLPGKENLPADSPECKACDETKQNEDGKDVSCLELGKKARNITQNIADANGTTANPGDTIEYTLSVKNTGKEVRKGFVVEENLEDVLEYADIIDLGGANYAERPVRMLTWAPVDIKPNETIVKTILIKVKSTGLSTPSAASDPSAYDMTMTNIYGNTVNINLPKNPVKVVEQTVTSLPSTGLGTNVLISTLLLAGATYFYFRSRLLVKEVGLVRKQFNYGMGV